MRYVGKWRTRRSRPTRAYVPVDADEGNCWNVDRQRSAVSTRSESEGRGPATGHYQAPGGSKSVVGSSFLHPGHSFVDTHVCKLVHVYVRLQQSSQVCSSPGTTQSSSGSLKESMYASESQLSRMSVFPELTLPECTKCRNPRCVVAFHAHLKSRTARRSHGGEAWANLFRHSIDCEEELGWMTLTTYGRQEAGRPQSR